MISPYVVICACLEYQLLNLRIAYDSVNLNADHKILRAAFFANVICIS